MMKRPLREALARVHDVPSDLRRVRALRAYVERPNRKVREYVARLYLRGDGIEIGALHSSLPLPDGATAQYVDRMSLEELQSEYPDLPAAVTAPDIVDDGE